MADVEKLLKEAVGELDRLLKARNVVGEPVTQGDVTILPLVSFGFGFGAGGGSGKEQQGASGTGGGTGGGGGIKPVALLIIDKEGARLEPIKGARSAMIESLGALAGKIAEGASRGQKKGKGKSEAEEGG
jgi:uncharacterized spore protein YtfJ